MTRDKYIKLDYIPANSDGILKARFVYPMELQKCVDLLFSVCQLEINQLLALKKEDGESITMEFECDTKNFNVFTSIMREFTNAIAKISNTHAIQINKNHLTHYKIKNNKHELDFNLGIN